MGPDQSTQARREEEERRAEQRRERYNQWVNGRDNNQSISYNNNSVNEPNRNDRNRR